MVLSLQIRLRVGVVAQRLQLESTHLQIALGAIYAAVVAQALDPLQLHLLHVTHRKVGMQRLGQRKRRYATVLGLQAHTKLGTKRNIQTYFQVFGVSIHSIPARCCAIRLQAQKQTSVVTRLAGK